MQGCNIGMHHYFVSTTNVFFDDRPFTEHIRYDEMRGIFERVLKNCDNERTHTEVFDTGSPVYGNSHTNQTIIYLGLTVTS